MLTLLLLLSLGSVEGREVTLTIRAFIQGFYLGEGKMVAAIDPEQHPQLCDTVTVGLLDTAGPSYRVLFTSSSVISTAGYGTFTFPASVLNGTYFIRLTHRNSLTTFGKYRVHFNDSFLYYDFTESPAMLCELKADSPDGFTMLYSGDLNHDGFVDSTDMQRLSAVVSSDNPYGYLAEDLNGDHSIDIIDMQVMQGNLNLPFRSWGGRPNSCLLNGVTKIFTDADNIRLSFNPSKDSLIIGYHIGENKKVQIINLPGQVVLTDELEKTNTLKAISVAALRQGIYAIRVTREGSHVAKRFVVVK